MNGEPVILIVDDIEMNRSILKEILKNEYTILEAENGNTAMEILKNTDSVSVVLLDIIMPGLDGYEVLRQMKADERLSKIPVIVNTQYGDEETENRCLNLGAVDFITKPYNVKNVKRRIYNIVESTVRPFQEFEIRLEEVNGRLQSLIDSVPGGIAICKVGQRTEPVYYNDNFCALSGYTREEFEILSKDDFLFAVYSEDREKFEREIEETVSENSDIDSVFRVSHKDGSIRWIHLSGVKYKDEDEIPIYHAVFMDITKEKLGEERILQAMEKLSFNATHDLLTGVFNREAFYEKTYIMLSENRNIDYAMLTFNIHRFKVVNDLFGKEKGDQVLKEIAHYFKVGLEGTGTYGRLEGDNFACCLPKKYVDLEKMENTLAPGFRPVGLEYDMAVYMGVYYIHDIEIPINLMCDRANLALQTVKGSYIRRYSVYDDTIRRGILQEQEIVNEMDAALDQGQFVVYLQPIYNLGTKRPVSAEALVRWKHPVKGMISPGIFIPVFEKSGFIMKLDMYVWEEVCKFLRRSQDEGKEVLPISVNVSRMDFYNSGLSDKLIKLVEKYDLDINMFRLEITETAYMDNPIELLTTMAKLQSYGFQILMDDFGSGFSSLNMLKNVPVDILKIDMQFINDLEVSNRAGNIMTSIVRLANWLDMRVVTEGVETKYQADFLRSIGCDLVQGYYFAKPMPLEEYEALLVKKDKKGSLLEENVLEQYDFDFLFNNNQGTNLLFNSMIGAVGIYELNHGILEVVRVNDGYYEIVGGTPKNIFQGTKDSFKRLLKGDAKRLLDACYEAAGSGRVEEAEVRRYHEDGHMIWLQVKIRHIGKIGANMAFYFAFSDITKKKELEKKRYLNQYSCVLRTAYDEIYELDYDANIFTRIYHYALDREETDKQMGLDKAIERYLDFVHPQDRALFRTHVSKEYLEELLKKEETHFLEIRIMKENNAYRWCTVALLKIGDNFGNLVCLCCIKEKEMETGLSAHRGK